MGIEELNSFDDVGATKQGDMQVAPMIIILIR